MGDRTNRRRRHKRHKANAWRHSWQVADAQRHVMAEAFEHADRKLSLLERALQSLRGAKILACRMSQLPSYVAGNRHVHEFSVRQYELAGSRLAETHREIRVRRELDTEFARPTDAFDSKRYMAEEAGMLLGRALVGLGHVEGEQAPKDWFERFAP